MGAQTSKEDYNSEMSEGRQCKIVLLNGQRLDIIVQSKLKTSDLVEITLSHFFVKEQHCFGLYTVESNYVYWLDPKKNVLDNEFLRRDGPLTIYLGVKFFLPSTSMIADLKAIELFYLQARSNITQGFLVCDASVLCTLAALALQFEHKDYADDAQFASVLARSQVLPSKTNNNQSPSDLESSIKQKYRDLSGMSRGEALVKYLRLVESQPTYGVHFYAVKDKRGGSHWLGISLNGIVVVEMDARRGSLQSRPQVFPWSRLENIFHNEKKFHFEESRASRSDERRLVNNGSTHQQFSTTDVTLHSFTSDSPMMSKCIWTSCVDQHHFYLETTKMKPVRVEVESLARELDESLSARKQGQHIETFHTERFKQMSEVIQHLRSKKLLLDNLLKDKMNLVKKLEDEETALTKLPPLKVELDEDFEKKWGSVTIVSDHYEANKTLSALDDIFKVEQKITVGYYKLVMLHNNTTAKLVHKMVTLQMTKGSDFKLKNPDLRKKWVDMYKSSLEKLKGIERKVNRYRRLLDMSCVDFASRFEDHKITQRPISSAQKQMVCRCANHHHEVLQEHNRQSLRRQQRDGHRQHRRENTRTSKTSDDSVVKVSICSVVTTGTGTTCVDSQKSCHPRDLHLQQTAQSQRVKSETVPSPSVISISSASSSSSASHQYPISDSSSSTLSSPYFKESKQPTNSGSLPRPGRRVDQGGVFAYPDVGNRPVVKNHSYDDLGGQPERDGQLRDAGTSALKMRVFRDADHYDTRSIKVLNKRYSYKMALECGNGEDDEAIDDEDGDNLYNVSSKRITHILTRSSSTHHAAQCHQHHQEHCQHQQNYHHNQDLGGTSQTCHHYHPHDHHHKCHQGHSTTPSTALHAGVASHDLQNLDSERQTHGHSRKCSDSAQPKERMHNLKPPPHRSEKQSLHPETANPRHPTLQYLPVDKSPSVTSAMSLKMRSSKSSLPMPSSSARNCSDMSNLTSCFKSQQKNSDFIHVSACQLEPVSPATPEYSGGGRKPKNFYTPPDLQKSFIKAETIDLSLIRDEDKVAWAAATSADVSFLRTIDSADLDGSLVNTSLFLDSSEWIHRSYTEDVLGGQQDWEYNDLHDLHRNQHLQSVNYNQCMDHFHKFHARMNYFSSSRSHPGESQEAKRERQTSSRHHCSSHGSGVQHHYSAQSHSQHGPMMGHPSSTLFSHQRSDWQMQPSSGIRRHQRQSVVPRDAGNATGNTSQRRLYAEGNATARSERPRTASCSIPGRHDQPDARPRDNRHRQQ